MQHYWLLAFFKCGNCLRLAEAIDGFSKIAQPSKSNVELTVMRVAIPAPVIAACAQIMQDRETHPSLDRLFMHAGAPGNSPEGSKPVKVQEWLLRINKDESVEPLNVLGRLIEA